VKTSKYLATLYLAILLPAHAAYAQHGAGRHPLLEDTFTAGVGTFVLSRDFKLRVDGESANLEFDFDKSANLSSHDTTIAAALRWRFGAKWSLWGEYFETEASRQSALNQDIEWKDVVFREGSFVEAGLDVTVARVFVGRVFSSGPAHEFGAGVGAHWLEIGAFIGGEVDFNEQSTGFYRDEVDAAAPLPNIGAWYIYAPGPQWALVSRLDWLQATFDEYSGGLWDLSLGAQYQMSDHFGVSLAYQYFRLDVDVDSSDWNGTSELTFRGPFLSLTGSW
jgi:hypothetical protein